MTADVVLLLAQAQEAAPDSTPWERVILGLVPLAMIVAGIFSKRAREGVTGTREDQPADAAQPPVPPSPAARTFAASVDALELLIHELQSSRDEAKRESAEARQQERDQDQAIDRLREDNGRLRVEVAQLRGQVSSLEAQIERLRAGGRY